MLTWFLWFFAAYGALQVISDIREIVLGYFTLYRAKRRLKRIMREWEEYCDD